MERDSGVFVLPAVVIGIWMGLSQSCEERRAKVVPPETKIELHESKQECVREEAK
jgi:hypothetical protein